jgi:tetratricopeptide (TPR) repeat protein
MSPRAEIEQLFSKGGGALSDGRFEDASVAFGAAVELAPANREALVGYASALRQSDRNSDALHVLNRAMYYHPNDNRVLTELGTVLVLREENEKAIATLDRALALDPDNQQAHQYKIRALRNSRLFEACERAIQEALARPLGDQRPIIRESAWALFEQKNYDAAVEAFAQVNDFSLVTEAIESLDAEGAPFVDAAVRRFPRNTTILRSAGEFYRSHEQFQAATQTFLRMLAVEPENEAALAGRIEALRRGSTALAEAAVKDALGRLPHSAAVLTQTALYYIDEARFDEAAEALAQTDETSAAAFFFEHANRLPKPGLKGLLDAAGRRFPHSAHVLVGIGYSYEQLRDFDKALAALDRAIALMPDLNAAWEHKIRALRLSDALDKAVEAIAQAPVNRDSGLLHAIGEAYFAKERYAEAVEAWLEAGDDLHSTTYHLLQNERFSEAEGLLDAALKSRPRDWELIRLRGNAYFREGDLERAIATYDEALGIDPDIILIIAAKTYCLRSLGRFQQAEECIDATISRWGRNALMGVAGAGPLLNQRGFLYYDQKRYAEAVTAFNEVLEVDRKNEDALLWRVRSLVAQRKMEEAAKSLTEALQLQPKSALLLCEQGRLYYRREDFVKAEQYYRQALQGDSGNLDIVDRLVALLNRLDRRHEALQLLAKLSAERPDDMDVVMQLVRFHLERNDLVRARKEFDILAEKIPESTGTMNLKGALCIKEKRYEEAEKEFRSAAAKEPFVSAFQSNIAWAILQHEAAEDGLYGQGSAGAAPVKSRLVDAEKCCRKALELDPNSSDAHTCLGLIAEQQGRLNEAIDYLREAVELNPAEGKYGDLGAVYLKAGRYKEGREMLQKACEVNRWAAQPLVELGRLHLQNGERNEALQLFREAGGVDPDNEAAPQWLAIALLKGGEFDEARRVLRDALRTLPKDRRWRIHLTLCQLLTELGDKNADTELHREALKEVSAAIALKAKHPDPYFYAGVVHYRLEDLGASLKGFQECLKLAPGFADAEQNIRRIKARIRSERSGMRGSTWVACILALLCAGGLLSLWYLYLMEPEKSTRISPAMLTTLTPLLLVLTIFSLLIPFILQYLNRLKLPGGVEVELSQPRDKISPGPSGSVGFGSASFTAGPLPLGLR